MDWTVNEWIFLVNGKLISNEFNKFCFTVKINYKMNIAYSWWINEKCISYNLDAKVL